MKSQPDLFTAGASHMCILHNSKFRGYNSIYQQAPHIAESEKLDFIGYCLTWYKFLISHADNEENSLFPRTEELLEDRTIFEESHKEHGFQNYLINLKSPGDFSGTRLLEILDSFQKPFEHEGGSLAHFEPIKPSKTPKAGSPGEVRTVNAFDKREGISLMRSGLTDVMPLFFFNFDREYEEIIWKDWPPVPAPVRWILMTLLGFCIQGGGSSRLATRKGREKCYHVTYEE
ncbi:hypothetical protein B0O99DRAFT_594086 [Bisporella sp. PMI_857]|nr:hypothetical protein B0O99DRAFT_594086 [Bisporella sp. PMI_857]